MDLHSGPGTEVAAGKEAPPLRLLAWEVTRRCPLHCRHCRGAARDAAYRGELDSREGRRLIDAVAEFARPVLILTGGEPMTREDVYDLAEYARERGLRVVMSPCGPLITDSAAERMAAAGIRRISLSLDGATAATHDAFRGAPGVFEQTVRGFRIARAHGLEVQVHTTVTRLNVDELPAILALAESLGAKAFSPFVLVPVGRGRGIRHLALDAPMHERLLAWIEREARRHSIAIRPTCAPEYYRFLKQRYPDRPLPDRAVRGCLGGQGFAFVYYDGIVQACGFLDVPAGDLRREGFDLARIYRESPLFQALRDRGRYSGACGVCRYWDVCGGCRGRAWQESGDVLGDDPLCPLALRRESDGCG